MEQQAENFSPPLNFEEKLKKYLLPPQLYIHLRYRKECRKVPEIRLMPFLCHPDKASLDVGANKGVYAYAMTGHSKTVHAFEPHPKMYGLMVSYLGSAVKAHKTALSNQTGTAKFHLRKTAGGYSNMGGSLKERAGQEGRADTEAFSFDVETKRLDDCDFGEIGFIKIDVEGFEMQVLEGAAETLRKHRPNLLIEVEDAHDKGASVAERVNQICKTYGYRCYALRRGQLTPFSRLDPETHFTKGQRSRDYIFNFIFLPE